MKKLAKVFGLVAVVACLAITLVACGGGVKGTYKYTEEEDGMKVTYELELKSGDKCEMRVTMEAEGEKETHKQQGTYKVDGEKITLTFEEDGEKETEEGTIKDGKITLGGGELVLKK